MNLLAELFFIFAKIGLFTFGGGYAMVSMIEFHCVEEKKWITHDDMMNAMVIAESTPGPIAINCATFVGFRQAGFAGALAATVGIILPPFLVIYIISMFLDSFLEIAWIASAFRGIKIGVGILILNVAVNMLRKMPKRKLSCGIMLFSFAVMLLVDFFAWNFSSISLMLIAGLFSLVLYVIFPDKWNASGQQEGGDRG